MEYSLRTSLKTDKEQDPLTPAIVIARNKNRRDRKDMRILKTMWILIGYGLSVFLGGFAIWGLDRTYCKELRAWRREIGLPWGILLEGHGWW